MTNGTCLCGAIAFEFDAPFRAKLPHLVFIAVTGLSDGAIVRFHSRCAISQTSF